jgi:predicted N-acetyltransferase YhbS
LKEDVVCGRPDLLSGSFGVFHVNVKVDSGGEEKYSIEHKLAKQLSEGCHQFKVVLGSEDDDETVGHVIAISKMGLMGAWGPWQSA